MSNFQYYSFDFLYNEDRNIALDVFNTQGQYHTFLPLEAIQNALRNFLTKHLDMGNSIKWAFNSSKSISLYKVVSESFMREWFDYITDWKNFFTWFKMSEEFIRECPIKEWNYISKYQKLSEKFIEEFRNEVDWDNISQHQILSKTFCYKHAKEVNWASIQATQNWFY